MTNESKSIAALVDRFPEAIRAELLKQVDAMATLYRSAGHEKPRRRFRRVNTHPRGVRADVISLADRREKLGRLGTSG